jgi:methylenetetrahydrofolate dehydrogenase (NADP+)/methenyltetrahydrofolate cyclohydrolase
MPAHVFDGKSLANKLQDELAQDVKKLKIQPCLAVALVGDDPASEIYVKNKQKACEQIGIKTVSVNLPGDATEGDVLDFVYDWNEDPSVHGILVQLPLPKQIDAYKIVNAISPLKDVDGFNAINLGSISHNRTKLFPCTPSAVKYILSQCTDLNGKTVAIVNRSIVVGQPLALMLMQNADGANATVTVCHDHTPPEMLRSILRNSDVIVSAVGKRPNFCIGRDMVKEGSILIDVGISRLPDGKVVGDLNFKEVVEVASCVTKVPGGVGPLTIAFLMKNTIEAAKLQYKGHT